MISSCTHTHSQANKHMHIHIRIDAYTHTHTHNHDQSTCTRSLKAVKQLSYIDVCICTVINCPLCLGVATVLLSEFCQISPDQSRCSNYAPKKQLYSYVASYLIRTCIYILLIYITKFCGFSR